jgi:hypothetical protein
LKESPHATSQEFQFEVDRKWEAKLGSLEREAIDRRREAVQCRRERRARTLGGGRRRR